MMTVHNLKSVIILVIVIMQFSNYQANAEVCNGDLTKMTQFCAKFVLISGPQIDPSPECCNVYKSADMACCCANIPAASWNEYSLQKVAYVAKFCGNPIAPGSICGGNDIDIHI